MDIYQEKLVKDILVPHALENVEMNYEPESVTRLKGGGGICRPRYPSSCEYIRVTTPKGYEVGFWSSLEWEEDGEVLGAILGLTELVAEHGSEIDKRIEKEIPHDRTSKHFVVQSSS